MKKLISFIILNLLFMGTVIAVNLNDPITPEDKANFDLMLHPVMKIYNLVKYSSTVIAAIMLLFSGSSYMIAGDDTKKRDDAKHIATYVIIGLAIIWATPLFINYFLS